MTRPPGAEKRVLGQEAMRMHACGRALIHSHVASLHALPDQESERVSQAIYGSCVEQIEATDSGWVLIETGDGYRGYVLASQLVEDRFAWRAHPNIWRVRSVMALVYFTPRIESMERICLPFLSPVLCLDRQGVWVRVALLDDFVGYMRCEDIAPVEEWDLEQMLAVGRQFVHLPYIWGGNSSLGFDCSGLVQTLFRLRGVLLPRDSSMQAKALCVEEKSGMRDPGDLLFFGRGRVEHVAVYLGDHQMLHATVHGALGCAITSVDVYPHPLLRQCAVLPPEFCARVEPIRGDLYARMACDVLPDNPVGIEALRVMYLSHWGYDACVHTGVLVVHELVVDEVCAIFQELFVHRFRIERMREMGWYGASDTASCADNNSSGFCSRKAVGRDSWSMHSYGLAIDINPLVNPYQRGETVIPESGRVYLDRMEQALGRLDPEGVCVRVFERYGWQWGGRWQEERGYVDWHHFEKNRIDEAVG